MKTIDDVEPKRGYALVCLGCGRHMDWRGANRKPQAVLCESCQRLLEARDRWDGMELIDVVVDIPAARPRPERRSMEDRPPSARDVELALLRCFPPSGTWRAVRAPAALRELLQILADWNQETRVAATAAADRLLVRLAQGEARAEDYDGRRR
jgi:hypothetical protein